MMTPISPEQHLIDAVVPICLKLIRADFRPNVAIENWGYPVILSFPDGHDYDFVPWGEFEGFIVADWKGKIHWLHPALRAELDKITLDMALQALNSESFPDPLERQSIAVDLMSHMQSDLIALDQRMSALTPFITSLGRMTPMSTVSDAWDFIEGEIACREIDPYLGWILAGRLVDIALAVEPALPDPGFLGYCIARYLGPANETSAPVSDDSLDRALCLAVEDEEVLSDDLKKHAACIIADACRHDQLPQSVEEFRQVTLRSKRARIAQIQFGHFDPPEGTDLTRLESRLSRIIGEYLDKSNHEGLALLAAGNGRLEAIGRAPVLTPALCLEHYTSSQEIPF